MQCYQLGVEIELCVRVCVFGGSCVSIASVTIDMSSVSVDVCDSSERVYYVSQPGVVACACNLATWRLDGGISRGRGSWC